MTTAERVAKITEKGLYPTEEAKEALKRNVVSNGYKLTSVGITTFINNCDFEPEAELYWQAVGLQIIQE